jgi:hypothetical protein
MKPAIRWANLQMEQATEIKFCVKLKKTAKETFEMMKSAYGEERLSNTSVLKLVVCILLRVLCQVQGFRLTQHCFEYFIR